jgi:hypothetical protein
MFVPQEHRDMEKDQKPSNSVCYTPSSEPFISFMYNRYEASIVPPFRVSETSCYYSQEHRDMKKGQKPSNSVCYTPSSEPFIIFLYNRYEAGIVPPFRVSETSCYYSQKHRDMEKGQKPSNSVCYTPL